MPSGLLSLGECRIVMVCADPHSRSRIWSPKAESLATTVMFFVDRGVLGVAVRLVPGDGVYNRSPPPPERKEKGVVGVEGGGRGGVVVVVMRLEVDVSIVVVVVVVVLDDCKRLKNAVEDT